MKTMGEWQPIETAPVGKRILMWWISVKPENTAAHCAMVGEVSIYRPDGSVAPDKPEYIWNPAAASCSHDYDPNNDTGYQPISIVTHWMPLPAGPDLLMAQQLTQPAIAAIRARHDIDTQTAKFRGRAFQAHEDRATLLAILNSEGL